MGTPRTTNEVLRSHLAYRKYGDLEWDLRLNYASDVMLLSTKGIHRGHDGVRYLAKRWRSGAEDASYTHVRLITQADVGMLFRTDSDGPVKIIDCAESYVVHNGLITAQIIHYSTNRSHRRWSRVNDGEP